MATIVTPLMLRGSAVTDGVLLVQKIAAHQGYYYPVINPFVFMADISHLLIVTYSQLCE
jgi:hypothetical protein